MITQITRKDPQNILSTKVRTQWISIADAARYVDCAEITIRRLISAGKIQATYLTPRAMRVSLESLNTLLSNNATDQWK